MRITPAQAAVLNARERQLLQTRGPYEVKQLATLIRRTRELRDKQRDLVQRQRIAATTQSRSKDSATVARTLKKEQLFSRALEHYETQLQKINSDCTAAMQELSLSRKRSVPRKAATGAATTARRTAGKTTKTDAPKAARGTGSAGSRTPAKSRTGVAARTRAQAAFR